MWGNPKREGILRKQGAVRKNWKKRWFIVQGNYLFYFKTKAVRASSLPSYPLHSTQKVLTPAQDPTPIRAVQLDNCSVYKSSRPGRPHLIEIASTDFERVFIIEAPNESVCEDWVQVIEGASGTAGVSAPFDIQHNIHVDFDSDTGFKV